jgi:poly(3-hydroxybutyrate) depolymerase
MNKYILILALWFLPAFAFSQNQPILTTKQKTSIIGNISQLLLGHYVFEDVAVKMSDHLKQQLKAGAYTKINDLAAFAGAITLDLYSIYHDRHLLVQYTPAQATSQPVPANNPASQDPLYEIKQANFGFKKTEILPGNIGYIQIERFWADSIEGKETTKAILRFVANTNAIIIDVRNCGGGSQEAVKLLCGYFLEKPTHINDMYDRPAKSITSYWTTPDSTFLSLADKPLYIICNNKTFSAGEEFCYDLQVLKRAIIVGEATGGGAHGTYGRDAGSGFTVNIPYSRAINPITKTNWETTGVKPDIEIAPDSALEKAELSILYKQIAEASDIHELFVLNWQLDLLEAINHPITLDTNTLKSYAGIFGDRVFTYRGRKLYYQRTGRPLYELEAIRPGLMKGKGNAYFKIEFITNDNGEVDQIRAFYQNNTVETAVREKARGQKVVAEKKVFRQNNDSIPYRLVHPENPIPNKKYPLLIYLHGMGTRGSDNEQPLEKFSAFFSDSTTANKFPCYVLIPQCPENDVWVSFPGFPNSLSATTEPTPAAKSVLALIHQLITTKNIDPDRIYLTGYSMGGEGTFDLLSREPDLFACGVPLASVADTSKANLIKDIPIWAFHGSEDNINNVKYSRLIIEAIKQKGGKPNYSEIKGVGHDCRNDAYLNEKLWKWIFDQHK